MQIAVLIACFNRVDTTVENLARLLQCLKKCEKVSANVFLVDDNSPDGTGDIVERKYPEIMVIRGSGALFWNRGMCLAYAHARKVTCDAYLIFNDDVTVDCDGVQNFLDAYCRANGNIPTAMVGATLSRCGSFTTYGAYRSLSKCRPLSLNALFPNGKTQDCDTFNGNFVLIPAAEMDALSGLDAKYHHMFGDIDLGLSLKAKGCRVLLAPHHVGVCERNAIRPPLRKFLDRVGGLTKPPLPVMDYIHFVFKHTFFPWAMVLSARYVVQRLWRVAFPGQ